MVRQHVLARGHQVWLQHVAVARDQRMMRGNAGHRTCRVENDNGLADRRGRPRRRGIGIQAAYLAAAR